MRAAVLDDDPAEATFVAQVIEGVGHACTVFSSSRALMAKLRQETYDMLVLDWDIREISAAEIATWARQRLSPPPRILMLTDRLDSDGIVDALNAGADDFLIKPLDAAVVRARIHAVLMRRYHTEPGTRVETFEGVAFDPLRQVATIGDERVQLTSKEFALALVLFRNMHRSLGRTYLMEAVWGRNPNLATRTLDQHVSRLRSKLKLRPDRGFRLAPVYSYGYRLERVTEPEIEDA